MIKFKNVNFAYKEKPVLNNVSFEIEKGERLCLLGESGSGKSTALKIIAGILKAKGVKGSLGKISMVFQENRLIRQVTVLKNITLFADEKFSREILCALNLGEDLSTPGKDLSGGMARRVALARALAVSFDALLLDEPFTGLDKDNLLNAAKLINEKTVGKTVIIVTHNIEEAKLLGCNRIINL